MSTTSLQHFPHSYSPFSSSLSSNRMAQSQTSGLDTLAEGSQYALEQLQMSREAAGGGEATDSMGKPKDQYQIDNDNHHNNHSLPSFKNSSQRDPLVEARSTIRKNSASAPVRRRISRACDQCNQLRTKCDGQNPCAHCIGRVPNSCLKFVPAGRAILTAVSRVRVDLRIRARTEEAWKGFKEGPRRGGRGVHNSWTAEWQLRQGRCSNGWRTHFSG
jgi:hypothetical protein